MPNYAGELAAPEVELTPTLLGRVAGTNPSELSNLSEASDRRITTILREQADTLRQIKEVKANDEDLEARLRTTVDEGQRGFTALKEATPEKELIVKYQAWEADRTVLERQLAEARSQLEERSKEISELKIELQICRADQARVEEDFDALERQKKEQESDLKRQIERLKREVEDGRGAVVELRRRMVVQERVTAEIINVATRMRDVNVEAMASCHRYLLGPKHTDDNAVTTGSASTGGDDFSTTSAMTNKTSNMFAASDTPSSSSFPPSTPPAIHAAFPAQSTAADGAVHSPTVPLSPQEALAGLAAFDLEAFSEAVNKTGLTIRKWQKQCKEYRDRGRGKIAYRNFQKGDLALFLPTRNSEARPWAAFNVSFPHYFLHVEDHRRDQLQRREWVVARIMSITERVVDLSVGFMSFSTLSAVGD
ncbi:oligomeric, coiled-coil, peripheral membrane protein [Tulasnella sp. UAMH 9824]|nr:oligomeric, coiled-coil, peripheral membrane protein [Tulasnella sp. UAMH 9824]